MGGGGKALERGRNEALEAILCRMEATYFALTVQLKVPKREIFDRSDFPDFYTIKSLRVGDFGVKIKKILQIFRGII
jgi:hypothetical protein